MFAERLHESLLFFFLHGGFEIVSEHLGSVLIEFLHSAFLLDLLLQELPHLLMLGPHLQLLIEVLLGRFFILLDALSDVLLLLLSLHVFVLVHDHVFHPVHYPRHLLFTGSDLAQSLLLSRFHRLNFILDGLGIIILPHFLLFHAVRLLHFVFMDNFQSLFTLLNFLEKLLFLLRDDLLLQLDNLISLIILHFLLNLLALCFSFTEHLITHRFLLKHFLHLLLLLLPLVLFFFMGLGNDLFVKSSAFFFVFQPQFVSMFHLLVKNFLDMLRLGHMIMPLLLLTLLVEYLRVLLDLAPLVV